MSETLPAEVSGFYLDLLGRIHEEVRPRTYLEIGMHVGHSLALLSPETLGIGVDPLPAIRKPINTTTKLFFETSDSFFARHDVAAELGGRAVDVAFIDGMHLFEYALRDFANVERWCGPDSVVLVHDCYPPDEASAARVRSTRLWTGDTWKLVPCLKAARPDLDVATVMVGPSGLAFIRNLDPASTSLFDRYDELVAEFGGMEYSALEGDKAGVLNAVPYTWDEVTARLPSGPLVEVGSAPASKKARRWNATIARHQAKRAVKLAAGRVLSPFRRGGAPAAAPTDG